MYFYRNIHFYHLHCFNLLPHMAHGLRYWLALKSFWSDFPFGDDGGGVSRAMEALCLEPISVYKFLLHEGEQEGTSAPPHDHRPACTACLLTRLHSLISFLFLFVLVLFLSASLSYYSSSFLLTVHSTIIFAITASIHSIIMLFHLSKLSHMVPHSLCLAILSLFHPL